MKAKTKTGGIRMKAIELKDILNYRFLSNIRYAPGGERAAFVVANANEEDNSYEQRLWLYEKGQVRQLTDLGKEGRFTWLDENRLLFPAVRSAKEKKRADGHEEFTSYYVLDLRGGEALPFMTLPFAAGDLRVLDEDHFVVSGTVDKLYPELFASEEEEKARVRKQREEDKDYEVFDELPWYFNGAGVTNGQRERLFLVQREPMTVTPLTALPEELLGFTVLGEEIFFAVNPRGQKLALKGFTLRARNRKTGEERELLRNEELAFAGMEAVGEKLWLFATEGRRFGLNENNWVYSLDPAAGELKLLRAEEYSLYNSVGSDCRLGGGRQHVPQGESLYHLTTREGDCLLYRMDPDGSDHPLIEKPGCIDAFDVNGDEALLIALYDMGLQELYRADLKTGEPAVLHCEEALLSGKHVITSNKGPIALHYNHLKMLARDNGVKIGCEGTVMSGSPALRLALDSLLPTGITEIQGILNGTTNYILTRMESGATYEEALAQAQQLGYAEADPSGDVEGFDTAGKVAILSQLVFNTFIKPENIERQGITGITPDDIRKAAENNMRWKLIGSVKKLDRGVEAWVRPVMLPLDNPLANISGAGNAIQYHSDLLGAITLIGPGAGRKETAAALIEDLMHIVL